MNIAAIEQDGDPFGWYYSQGGFSYFTTEKREWYDAVGIEEVTPLYTRPATDARIAELERDNKLSADDIAYPCDLFQALITGNSPYAFYIFQWVPYQTDAQRWRLKMQHDVRTFDGREAFNIWPNSDSCGPFKDGEVEFIRISKKQFAREWVDPRQQPAKL